jgi:hypothetical protein
MVEIDGEIQVEMVNPLAFWLGKWCGKVSDPSMTISIVICNKQ